MKIEAYSPTIRRKEMDAVLTAMVDGKIGPVDQAKLLVQAAREKIRFEHCLALRSPVIALNMALKLLGIETGQGVILSALSPRYYSTVIEGLGLIPVYCDVHSSTTCISKETVEKAITSKPAALELTCIVLHHSLGYLCDGPAIAELGLPIIEDCSQSFGSNSDGNPVGNAASRAEFSILGLEERDMLGSGGGALLYSLNRRVSASQNLVQKRNAGILTGDLPPEYGLPGMNAALAMVNLKEVEKRLLKRREIAQLYTQSALRTRHKRFIQPDVLNQSVEYNNFAFALILETGMKDVKAYGRRKEIAVENAFESTIIGSGLVQPETCPEAYSLSLRTVLFPIYPRLSMTDAGKVAKLIQTLP